MGGLGSGRHEYADTPTVEECRQLDVDELTELTDNPGAEGAMWWGDREDPAATIALVSKGERDLGEDTQAGALQLKYTVTKTRTEESREYDYAVPLAYTDCNFGGVRPWFRCPKCHARRGKLYLPPGKERFLCRECYDLGYTSSRTSGDDLKQAELRYRRAFARADKDGRRPHPNGEPYLPERAKGMHRETFEQLKREVELAGLAWHGEMRKQTNRLLERLGADRRINHPDTALDAPIPAPVDEE